VPGRNRRVLPLIETPTVRASLGNG